MGTDRELSINNTNKCTSEQIKGRWKQIDECCSKNVRQFSGSNQLETHCFKLVKTSFLQHTVTPQILLFFVTFIII